MFLNYEERIVNHIMKIKRSNIFEFFIFTLSVTGSFLVVSLSPANQFTGFCLWIIANTLAIVFFIYHKMYIMMLQFVVYLLISVKAVIMRL